MTVSHNQMAYVAIVSTLIFGSLFVGATGFFQTSEGAGDFDPAVEDDLIGDGSNTGQSQDRDDDGVVGAHFHDSWMPCGWKADLAAWAPAQMFDGAV